MQIRDIAIFNQAAILHNLRLRFDEDLIYVRSLPVFVFDSVIQLTRLFVMRSCGFRAVS